MISYTIVEKRIVFEKKLSWINMLTIANEGSFLTIFNKGLLLTIVNETTNFIKTGVFNNNYRLKKIVINMHLY